MHCLQYFLNHSKIILELLSYSHIIGSEMHYLKKINFLDLMSYTQAKH